ncbi:hypothetical protein GH714_021312 [Hevea brasiliensis]|uniref:Uncharacterized protein n=1 Tax=Hevea brasiliensis TaxID=3981 RepID=A0A6A6MN69_HEVBR|nr:hypothetical protein GH714_021312 [Hevea brasiliensis]
MVRAPCCEKMGLKKGPWTPEEDKILISHIQKYGHSNWRALPKQAGLLRCGKSCRLRWINYLRPDIKRGNFTEEEEKTIIKLHEMLGNSSSRINCKSRAFTMSPQPSSSDLSTVTETSGATAETENIKVEKMDSSDMFFPLIDQDLWSEAELAENSSMELASDSMVAAGFYSNFPRIDDDNDMDFWCVLLLLLDVLIVNRLTALNVQ